MKGQKGHGPFNSVKEARAAALALSKRNPRLYYMLYSAFGLFVSAGSKRLHVFAPSSAWGGTYWIGGKEKRFTSAQKIEDQNRTPTMR